MATRTAAELRGWARNEVITDRRLKALGFTRGEVRSLVRRELLFPGHLGVYFLSATPTRQAVWTAAVARCGAAALLSHGSAAALWRVATDDGGWPHVTVPRGGPRNVEGIRIHWTTRTPDPAARDLIPVTTLPRTLDDFARTATDHAVKRALRQAEHHHALDLAVPDDQATSRRLKQVLKGYVRGQGKTDSELEADFFELVATRTTLPRPELQRRTPGGRADFVWPQLGLIAEVDGYDAHRGRIAFRDDRARDRRNLRAGMLTLRFTWEDVQLTPAGVAADLESAASSRSMPSSTAS